MDEILRIDANQGSFDTSGSKSIADIDIPSGMGSLDLSKSYISVRVIANEGTVQALDGYTPATSAESGTLTTRLDGTVVDKYVALKLNTEGAETQNLVYSNTASLIRNASMFSQNRGKLEDIRRVDMLKSTLAVYQTNLEEDQHDIGRISGYNRGVQFNTQEYGRLVDSGTDPSREELHKDIVIPLSSVMNCCKTDNYSTDAYGRTRLHFEFNFDKLETRVSHQDLLGSDGIANGDANANYFGTPEGGGAGGFSADKATSVRAGNFGDVVATGADQDVSSITTSHAYVNKSNSPFWVGMPLAITAVEKKNANNAVANKTSNNSVVSITHNANGTITLQLSQVIFKLLLTDDKLQTIRARIPSTIVAGSSSVSIERVQLVAYVNNSGARVPPALQYTTYISNEDTYSSLNNQVANRVYQIPEACKNFYIMFFNLDENGTVNGATSEMRNLHKYRFTIDNKEITPTAVEMDSPKHFDLISQLFMNNGEPIHSLLEKQFFVGTGTNKADVAGHNRVIVSKDGYPVKLIGCPVPFVNRPQNLQIEMEPIAGQSLSGRHIIYFECSRAK